MLGNRKVTSNVCVISWCGKMTSLCPSHHECIFVIVLLLSLVTGQTRCWDIFKKFLKKFRKSFFVVKVQFSGGFLTKASRSIPELQSKCKENVYHIYRQNEIHVAFSSWGIWHVTQHPNRTGEGDSLHYHASLKESQSEIKDLYSLLWKYELTVFAGCNISFLLHRKGFVSNVYRICRVLAMTKINFLLMVDL